MVSTIRAGDVDKADATRGRWLATDPSTHLQIVQYSLHLGPRSLQRDREVTETWRNATVLAHVLLNCGKAPALPLSEPDAAPGRHVRRLDGFRGQIRSGQ